MKHKWRIYLVLVLVMVIGASIRPLYAADAVVGTATLPAAPKRPSIQHWI